jgi:hypothetical protein
MLYVASQKSENILYQLEKSFSLDSLKEFRKSLMTARKPGGWHYVAQAAEQLGMKKETLLKYRDDGTLKLGPHFASFDGITYSRDSYLWCVPRIKRDLDALQEEFAAA